MKDNKNILLVEDDRIDAITVKRVFKKLDITNPLIICENGEEALSWLEEPDNELPGLILLDLNMPRMGGLEFLKILKKKEKYQMIPVVILTTSADPNDRKESFKNAASGYMLKSVDHKEFIETFSCIKNYWKISELAY